VILPRTCGRPPGSRFAILALAAFLAPGGLAAQGAAPGPGWSPPVELRLAATWVDLDGEGTGGPGLEFTLVDPSPRLWRAGVLAGVMLSPQGQAYAYGGIHTSLSLPWALQLRPSLAAGVYARGDGRELGSPLEFRSALSVERSVGEVRLALYLYHLSNAGLGALNPGLEGIGLGFSVPVSP
jgi:lipid A 3-O-deacylase